jgi:tetratricopeptide (TPR) repeat protein
MSAPLEFDGEHLLTTDGEIAVINLESMRSRSWSRFFADLMQTGSAEAVVENEQLTSQLIGDVFALDRLEFLVAELVKVNPASARTALVRAQVASMTHRFADARNYLAQAGKAGASEPDVYRLRLNVDQACGENLGSVLDARRKLADESRGLPDQIALASLLGDMGDFNGAARAYDQGLQAYEDVSPFPLAWVCFQLGMLWGELVPEPDHSRAAEWYRRAVEFLPPYTKARIHLAEIYASRDQLIEAEAMLLPAVSSRDPEVLWRLADVTTALGKQDSEAHMRAARIGYDYLLARHLLAFADHGAEFYAGSGNDPSKALQLARVNIANRPTLRAFEQGHAIALSCGDNAAGRELLAAATERWGGTVAFQQSSLARHRVNRLEGVPA